jgi:hypothetical protein
MLAREVGKTDQEDSFVARYTTGVLRTRSRSAFADVCYAR